MSFEILGVRIKVSFLLIVLLTLFSLYDKSGFMLLAVSAALIHEFGHIVSAEITGCGVKELSFMPFGIKMILKTPLSLVDTKRKLLVLSAGCAVNFIIFVLFWMFCAKQAALIHLATGLFNLLPAGTLDGGRILQELLSLRCEETKAQRIADAVSLVSAAVLFVLGAVMLVYSGYNISLLITSIYLTITVIVRQKKLN